MKVAHVLALEVQQVPDPGGAGVAAGEGDCVAALVPSRG